MHLLIRLIINVFALLVVDYLLPGFNFASYVAAIVAVIVIGAINTFIRPIIQIIALPVSILTLGISAFFINVILLWAASFIVPGFVIDSFLTAIVASIMLSLVSWFLQSLSA